MRFSFVFSVFFASYAFAGLPPPQGRSIRVEAETPKKEDPSIFDLSGRMEQRNRLIQEEKTKEPEEPKIKRKPSAARAPVVRTLSNLPDYLQNVDRKGMKASDKVVYVPQNSGVRLGSVKSGDIFQAVVEQKIKASPSVPTPVRATVLSGRLKGGFFVGEATLDRELKRILFSFNKVRSQDGKVYQVKAAGLSPQGSIGIEGYYNSQAGTYFLGELASVTAAGVLDSTINRNQTSFGTFTQEPSLANASKAGAVTALSRTADRMAEGARQAPEYTEAEGYQEIQVIVQDEPIELN